MGRDRNTRKNTFYEYINSKHISKNIFFVEYYIENNYNKRRISEMIHIKEQTQGIKPQDTENLDKSYFTLLESFHRNKNK